MWKRTLAPQENDVHAAARERLRVNYEACTASSALIAASIAIDHPDFTVHDLTHVEALWDLADMIAGEEYSLTPIEGFVLGCAMLVHDLAMSTAAYPTLKPALIGSDRWRDTVYVRLQDSLGRSPNPEELANAPESILRDTQRELLRELHGENAARMPHEQFQDRESDSVYYLIPDTDLRNMFGDTIGRIAASHWQGITEITEEFDSRLGAPAAFPKEWTVDPLKLACLLRVADASHLDGRRAPGFLRAIRSINARSRNYWIFQERLNRPWLDVDRLTFTAHQPFLPEDADAWWLCVESLRTVDSELRGVDAALADMARPRFAARSVAYVDDLERLSRSIPVRDWYPVDAQVQVGDVIELVRKLGGRQLYGDDSRAALRELISNAADALRARQAIAVDQAADELRLRVQVQITVGDDGSWLIVRDNGIGMSREVMSGPLLDFGRSYWRSNSARREFPGLVSSGFSPTGQFGIGFFSVFMLGDQVRVVSRRFDLGNSDTNVLIFRDGLGSRPLLRKGLANEVLVYGGTEISVKLNDEMVRSLSTVLGRDLSETCLKLFPAADVNLDVILDSDTITRTISANDWQSCSGSLFLDRLVVRTDDRPRPRTVEERLDQSLPQRFRLVTGDDGEIFGRLAIPIGDRRLMGRNPLGLVTAGGMRTQTYLSRIAGILLGKVERAARDSAVPLVTKGSLANWASEQARIVLQAASDIDPMEQQAFANIVTALGGDPGDLIVAQAKSGYLSSSELAAWAADRGQVRLYQDAAFYVAKLDARELNDDILVVEMGIPTLYHRDNSRFGGSSFDLEPDFADRVEKSIEHWCVRILARAWDVEYSELNNQLNERLRVVREYEHSHRYNRRVDIDLDYPFTEPVATDSAGKVIMGHVTIVRRETVPYRSPE